MVKNSLRVGNNSHLIVFAALLVAQLSLASGTATAQDVNAIVASMVRAQRQNRAQHIAYEVLRSYQIFRVDQAANPGKVTAAVDFLPPGAKTFKIVESSGGMVEHVVRKSLEHEAELTQDPSESEYSPQNYEFGLLGQEKLQGNLCYILSLKPRHESKDLLIGRAWVDAKTFLIRRVEGEPSKSLSFWLKDVRIVFTYKDVDGMWLRTESHATAHVRFAGEMNLISHDVNFRPMQAEEVASIGSGTPAVELENVRYSNTRRRSPAPQK